MHFGLLTAVACSLLVLCSSSEVNGEHLLLDSPIESPATERQKGRKTALMALQQNYGIIFEVDTSMSMSMSLVYGHDNTPITSPASSIITTSPFVQNAPLSSTVSPSKVSLPTVTPSHTDSTSPTGKSVSGEPVSMLSTFPSIPPRISSNNSAAPSRNQKEPNKPTAIESQLPLLSQQTSQSPSMERQTISSLLPSVQLPLFLSTSPSDVEEETSVSPTLEKENIFTCTQDGIVRQETVESRDSITVHFQVGVLVEISLPLSEYLDSLEKSIVASALVGSLQCGIRHQKYISGTGNDAKPDWNIPVNTQESMEPCVPILTSCIVLQIEFELMLNATVDPDLSSFLGYLMVREEVNDGTILVAVPAIDRIAYLRPLPILPPVFFDDDDMNTDEALNESAEKSTIGPWGVSSAVIACTIGPIALACFYLHRRYRNGRHQMLVEDMSLGSP